MPNFTGTTGDDNWTGTSEGEVASGDAGNDTLNGLGGNDIIDGGEGDDVIDGGEGNDDLTGGMDVDWIYGGDGNDVIRGGIGFNPAVTYGGDRLSGEAGDDVIYIDVDGALAMGGIGNDTVYGGDGPDEINGEDGDDRLYGGANADGISGGNGADIIEGGSGDDTLLGYAGADDIRGGDGHDVIDGGADNDTLSGGEGDDTLQGGAGDDIISGDAGNDVIQHGEGADTIDGGSGSDTYLNPYFDQSLQINLGQAGSGTPDGPILAANSVVDRFGVLASLVSIENVSGSVSDDIILGNDEANRLSASDGMDVIDGRGGDDIIEGGHSRDTLTGGAGNDIFSGTQEEFDDDAITDLQPGDRIHITDMSIDNYNLRVGPNALFLPTGTIILRDIDVFDFTVTAAPDGGIYVTIISTSVNGTSGNDVLNGTADSEYMFGGEGNDTLNGMGGDDFLDGGPGDDLLNGDAGTDTAVYGSASAGVSVSLGVASAQDTGGAGTDTLSGIENLTGSEFDDVLVGNGGANRFIGNAGNDSINGGDSVDTVDYSREGGDGRIYVNLSSSTTITTATGVIVAAGSALDSYGNADTLSSIEHVITGISDDYVFGGEGDERIQTGAGVDYLIGNGGADIMIGGAGNDVYFFRPSEGDQIVEYADGGSDDSVYILDQTFSLTGYENFESFFGYNAAGHTLTGTDSANLIVGYTGADTIYGQGGDDGVYGGSGNDMLFGGDGLDVVSGNAGSDTLDGGNGADTLTAGVGNDVLTGGAGTDSLTGGGGNDTFIDTVANLNGDRISDFSAGDRIILTDANINGFTFSITGNTLNFTGGSMILGTVPRPAITVREAAGGGVELSIANDVRNDFNGDGRSDILWRNVDGQMSNWLGQANGGFTHNNANAAGAVWTAWMIAGTGDFNGDGRDDILWRNADGQLSNWLGTASGGFTPNDANAARLVSTDWQVVGTGDFNGDGRDDILWRNSDGTVTDWLGTTTGGFNRNDTAAARFVPSEWSVVGTGDFNGDGRDDILWRKTDGTVSNWLGNINGGFTINDGIAQTAVSTDWKVAGVGDFNGDGHDDILWRNDNGMLSNWLGQVNGSFVNNGAVSGTFVPLEWSVVAIGDYNGDGRDDILWRNADGTVTDWLANANGSFTPNDANAAQSVPTAWHVQPEAPFL